MSLVKDLFEFLRDLNVSWDHDEDEPRHRQARLSHESLVITDTSVSDRFQIAC